MDVGRVSMPRELQASLWFLSSHHLALFSPSASLLRGEPASLLASSLSLSTLATPRISYTLD